MKHYKYLARVWHSGYILCVALRWLCWRPLVCICLHLGQGCHADQQAETLLALKLVEACFVNRMFLSLLYCLSSDTSSEIGEISLNLPWASGYDWQDLIKLYLHLHCLQSEYCPGKGLRDHCPVIVLTPFHLKQARNRRLGEMQGRGWKGTSVLCMRVSSVSAALPGPGVRPSRRVRALLW